MAIPKHGHSHTIPTNTPTKYPSHNSTILQHSVIDLSDMDSSPNTNASQLSLLHDIVCVQVSLLLVPHNLFLQFSTIYEPNSRNLIDGHFSCPSPLIKSIIIQQCKSQSFLAILGCSRYFSWFLPSHPEAPLPQHTLHYLLCAS